MRRQINADELADFYRIIGKTIWHVQHLENVMVNFLVMRDIYERQRAGHTVTAGDVQSQLAEKRKITLGPLIESCQRRKIIRPEHQSRFETFKLERHWLVHQSLIQNGDDLYLDSARQAIFDRISAIEDDAISLRGVVFRDFESWSAAHGVNTEAAADHAKEAIRRLKGT